MKKTYRLILCWLVLGIVGCSIDISQPTIPASTLTPTTIPDQLTAPSVQTTKAPVTWSNLNLSGKLVYINSELLDNFPSSKIQALDLATGETKTIFRAPKGAWIFYMSTSSVTNQIVMSYISTAGPDVPSNRALYIVPLNEAQEPQLLFTPPTPDDHYVHVEWSPDGKYIYYVHYNYNNRPAGQLDPVYTLFRIAYPDGQPEKLADNAFWPRVSSDSSKLVYVSIDTASETNGLVLANADGTDPQSIAFSESLIPEIIDAPIFSPDGQTIIFSAPPPVQQVYEPNWFEKLMGIQIVKAHDVPSDWWSVPVTGGEPIRLTQLETINLFASISPDEKYIASLSGDGLFAMDTDGSNLTRLISDQGVLGTVNWIP
jgi:Tol biopolymer transport system component